MSPHLEEYKRDNFTYTEHDRRFSLRKGGARQLKAYNIDITKGGHYFHDMYRGAAAQGFQSADGLYLARLDRRNSCMIVIELEGEGTSFKVAQDQVIATINHFCQTVQNSDLRDDGQRHHQHAVGILRNGQQQFRYPLRTGHRIVGLVVGSKPDEAKPKRLQNFAWEHDANGHPYPILRIDSRRPEQDKALVEFLKEVDQNTGETRR